MKPTLTSLRNRGSILVTSLVSLTILGSVLAGYLLLLRHQRLIAVRSQAWNKTIPIAEAGVEEALTQLNFNGTNITANNGFALTHGKYILKRCTFNGDEYVVGVSVSTNPIIVSQGFSTVPYTGATVTRILKIRTDLARRFAYCIATDKDIDLKGNKIAIDGFDSEDPLYSTGGFYDVTKRKANVQVGTNSSLEDSLNVGNASIYGEVTTGAGGTVRTGSNGSVGDVAWVSSGTKGIQPGAVKDDFNVTFRQVDAPYASALPPPSSVKVDGVNYDYVLDTGDYKITAPLKFQGKVLVRGDARLLVTDDITFGGSDELIIASGGSLKLYVSAANASFGGVANQTGFAKNFLYFGLPTNTSVSYHGNGEFAGAFYAPQAEMSIGGGGSSDYDFVGSVVARTLKMNGNMNIHYDEALSRIGPPPGYVATSWDEINITWDQILQSDLDLDLL